MLKKKLLENNFVLFSLSDQYFAFDFLQINLFSFSSVCFLSLSLSLYSLL